MTIKQSKDPAFEKGSIAKHSVARTSKKLVGARLRLPRASRTSASDAAESGE